MQDREDNLEETGECLVSDQCAQSSKMEEARKQPLIGLWNIQTLNIKCRLEENEKTNIEVALSKT